MKRILLLAIIAGAVGMTANAQTQKGYYLIGGDIGGIKADLQKDASAFGIQVNPKVAWFIKDNFALGGQVILGYQTQKNTGNTFTYSVGPVARYYFSGDMKEIVKHTTFFAEANAGIGGNNYNPKTGPSSSVNGLDLGIGPGLAYFINENVALEALAKYNLNAGFGNAPVRNSINIGVGFQIYLPGSKLKEMKGDMQSR